MQSCWVYDYKKRNSFCKAVDELEKIYNNKKLIETNLGKCLNSNLRMSMIAIIYCFNLYRYFAFG